MNNYLNPPKEKFESKTNQTNIVNKVEYPQLEKTGYLITKSKIESKLLSIKEEPDNEPSYEIPPYKKLKPITQISFTETLELKIC